MSPQSQGIPVPPLQAVEIGEFISMPLAEPAQILAPILREGSLVMIHGPAGCGKTFLMLAIAIASAYGVPILGWSPAAPVTVLYIDGEMTATELQARVKALLAPIIETISHVWNPLHIVTPDFQPHGLRKIDMADGRTAVLDAVAELGPRLVIFDNLSCLTNPEDDNAASGWSAVQELLLVLRRRGIACIVGHHSGKSGAQRGTSRRADILDVVLKLCSVHGAEADGRTRVTVEFEKGRGLTADQKEAFVACLEAHPHSGLMWTRSAPAMSVVDRVRTMLADGMPATAVASELKTATSYVYRIRNEMLATGELDAKEASRARHSPFPHLGVGAKGNGCVRAGECQGEEQGNRGESR